MLESVSQIATSFTSRPSIGLVIFSLSHDDYCHFILSPFPQPANPTPTNPVAAPHEIHAAHEIHGEESDQDPRGGDG